MATDIQRAAHVEQLLDALPKRLTRKAAADILRKYYFEVSPRTLERWPLAWQLMNGKAHCDTADLLDHAEAVLAASPAIRGGHQIHALLSP